LTLAIRGVYQVAARRARSFGAPEGANAPKSGAGCMTNVVIGAASGMGAATARKLAPRGRPIVADYNLEGARQIAAEIGGDVVAVGCDITDQGQVDSLMSAVDTLEALVITAGMTAAQAPDRRLLEVNVVGVARVLRAAEPLLTDKTVGIAVASQSGYMVPELPELFAVLDDPLAPDFIEKVGRFIEFDTGLAYQLSKRAVHRMARRLSFAWGAKGARILSLSPGINDTQMNRSEEAKNPVMLDMIKACPLQRRGTPDEIANVVAFLTSAEASAMTGSDVLVDCGMRNILPVGNWDGKLKIPDPVS
jgi:NAD(P)-dependent dehydrogenase (short-subunit alcohol dehydrogenase family)